MKEFSYGNFKLPANLIAQKPLQKRTKSKLLILKKDQQKPSHKYFNDIVDYFNKGDALVLNNTKVFPARLFAKKEATGGKIELLLSRKLKNNCWLALISANKTPAPGTKFIIDSGSTDKIRGTILERYQKEPGAFKVLFSTEHILQFALANGNIPLPPYIKRIPTLLDQDRYQTVFAQEKKQKSVAAPTAGLHFDHDLIEKLKQKGVNIVEITLHVGPGTFLPIHNGDIGKHKMHGERWSISSSAAKKLNAVKKAGNRIVAVGTTALRTLETAMIKSLKKEQGIFTQDQGISKLFIKTPFDFRAADALITNFHLPNTTLLLLVAAIVGQEKLLQLYQEAIKEKYRFFSYGDACLFEINNKKNSI